MGLTRYKLGEMKELMQREKESQKMLEEAFKGIGYSIEQEEV